MSQGAADWYIKKPFILAVLGTSLTAGRLSGNLWWMRLMANARCLPEAVGPVILQNFGKGSQQSPYGVATAPDIAAFNPTHIMSEDFSINNSASALGVVTIPMQDADMQTMHDIWKAKNPAVDITWQSMNGVSAAGASLRPNLPDYYAAGKIKAAAMGDGYLDHYNGLPSPPAIAGGWPKPLPEYMTDSNDGLHPIWDGALELYFWPGFIYWLRCKMAVHWGLEIPNPPEPPPVPDAEYLVIAGGGGGGAYVGAGGGAGGRRRGVANLTNLLGSVWIGAGGSKGSGSGPTSLGFSGEDSFLAAAKPGELRAVGGGYGAGYAISPGMAGGDGGSGGGSYGPGVSGGSNVPGQGNVGGTGLNPNSRSGGGGGAGGAGGSGASGGAGGAGVLADWPGVPALTYVCGGGPGVAYPSAPQAYSNGGGPTNYGGGGRGGDEASNAAYVAHDGGEGRVVVWYPGAARATGGTVTTYGGFTIHTFARADMSKPANMTANNAPAGYVASADSIGRDPWYAFSGQAAGARGWYSQPTAYPHWLQQQFPAPRRINAYILGGYNGTASPEWKRTPSTWELRGSNDPTFATYTVLDSRAGEVFTLENISRLFMCANPGTFSCVRLYITAAQVGAPDNYCEVGRLQLWTTPELQPL